MLAMAGILVVVLTSLINTIMVAIDAILALVFRYASIPRDQGNAWENPIPFE